MALDTHNALSYSEVDAKNTQIPYTDIKRNKHVHKHQTQMFEEFVPSVVPLLTEHIRLGHAGIVHHSAYIDTS